MPRAIILCLTFLSQSTSGFKSSYVFPTALLEAELNPVISVSSVVLITGVIKQLRKKQIGMALIKHHTTM
jgi:hypothetical protein